MKRALILAAALALQATAASASSPAPKTEDGQFVTISPVAVPIILNGRLVNYVFVNIRIELASNANAPRLREREPYFRDALVRAAHRTPFTLASDLTKVDEAKLKSVMLREAQTIAGPGAVRGIQLVSQTPKSLRVSTQ